MEDGITYILYLLTYSGLVLTRIENKCEMLKLFVFCFFVFFLFFRFFWVFWRFSKSFANFSDKVYKMNIFVIDCAKHSCSFTTCAVAFQAPDTWDLPAAHQTLYEIHACSSRDFRGTLEVHVDP